MMVGGGGRIIRDQMKHWVKTNLWGHLGPQGFPGGSDGKESACQCRRLGCDPWVGKIPWRKKWSPTPQYSCLENSKGGGAWRAIVHGVAKESHMTERLTLTLPGFNVCG